MAKKLTRTFTVTEVQILSATDVTKELGKETMLHAPKVAEYAELEAKYGEKIIAIPIGEREALFEIEEETFFKNATEKIKEESTEADETKEKTATEATSNKTKKAVN